MMTFEEFSRALIATEDLDPVYVGLQAIQGDARLRWLLAYSCFYHCGVSCWLAEWKGAVFWNALELAAANIERSPVGERWPRASERRHFRGALARKAVADLRARYSKPEEFFEYLTQGPYPIPFSVFQDRVSEHYSYGRWFSFKGADLAERVLGIPVSFSEAEVFLYEEPRKGAELVYDLSRLDPAKERVPAALEYAKEKLGKLRAPPTYDRFLNLQEFETCFCKWKAHVAGRYEVGKDIREIRHGLVPWIPYSPLARKFEGVLPAGPKEKRIWD